MMLAYILGLLTSPVLYFAYCLVGWAVIERHSIAVWFRRKWHRLVHRRP